MRYEIPNLFFTISFAVGVYLLRERRDNRGYTKETPYYLGYFEGAVNGQDISIRNKSASWRYIDAGFYSEVRRENGRS